MGYSDEAWWERGNCRTVNPQIFDGQRDKGGRPRKDGTRTYNKTSRDWTAAKSVCAACPVQPACLEYVLSMPQEWNPDASFAAGFTPEQLAEIRKRRSRSRR